MSFLICIIFCAINVELISADVKIKLEREYADEILRALPVNFVSEITSSDIELRNAQTLDEALEFVSGVRLTVGAKNEPNVTMRGFSQERVLVLLDGVPISDPIYGFSDLNQIPVENIERIEVIKGSASALFGANTMSGVINIITKKPDLEPYFKINTMFSENNTQDYVVSYGKKFDKFDLWFSGSHRESDGYNLSSEFTPALNEDGGLRENSDYNRNAFNLRYGFVPNKKNDTVIFFNYIANQKALPYHISSTRPKYWRFEHWGKWSLSIVDKLQVNDKWLTEGRIYYDKYDNVLNMYNDSNYSVEPSSVSTYDDYSSGCSLYSVYRFNEKNSLKSSIILKKDVHKEQDDTGREWENYQTETYSIALEDELKPTDDLLLLGGISCDIFRQKESYTEQSGDVLQGFNPMLGITYFIGSGSSIYGSVSKKIRFPTIYQLYSSISGDPDLKEQTNIACEIGTKYYFGQDTMGELGCFCNDISNLIDRESKRKPYINIPSVIIRGIESSLHSRLTKHCTFKFSYTYLDARNKKPELLGRSDEELSYIPEHKVDLELKYNTGSGFSTSILGTYNTETYYYDRNNVKQSLDENIIMNTRITQNYLSWKFCVIIDNVFDRNYQEEEGYPQPGRTLQLRIDKLF